MQNGADSSIIIYMLVTCDTVTVHIRDFAHFGTPSSILVVSKLSKVNLSLCWRQLQFRLHLYLFSGVDLGVLCTM
jgi:hypothetical protein